MLESKTLAVAIARDWRTLYAEFWEPEAFSRWAAGLAQSALTRDGETWVSEGSEGQIRIHFTDRNAFGVMDHGVELADGRRVEMPMRIVANGDGATVLITVFRQPWMSDGDFAADEQAVRRDLAALKALAER